MLINHFIISQMIWLACIKSNPIAEGQYKIIKRENLKEFGLFNLSKKIAQIYFTSFIFSLLRHQKNLSIQKHAD
jgi:hypothetical protein